MAYSFDPALSQSIVTTSRPFSTVPATFSIWVYVNQGVGNFAFGYMPGQGVVSEGRCVVIGDVGISAELVSNNGSIAHQIYANFDPVDGWQHVCLVRFSSIELYINGVLKASDIVDPAFIGMPGTRVGLAQTYVGGTSQFQGGVVAEAAIWNFKLTQAEIESLAKGFSAKRVRPQNLRFYFPMIRNLGDCSRNLSLTSINSYSILQHPGLY